MRIASYVFVINEQVVLLNKVSIGGSLNWLALVASYIKASNEVSDNTI